MTVQCSVVAWGGHGSGRDVGGWCCRRLTLEHFGGGAEVPESGAGLKAPFEADGLACCEPHGSFVLVAVADAPEDVAELLQCGCADGLRDAHGCGWPVARI